MPAAGCGVGHRTIGQPDNLVDPPQGRRDTMEGPADSSDPAQVVTDAVVASPPPDRGRSARPAAAPVGSRSTASSPSEPPRIEVRAWLARLGALTAPMTGGEVAIEAARPGAQGTSLSRSHGAGDARRSPCSSAPITPPTFRTRMSTSRSATRFAPRGVSSSCGSPIRPFPCRKRPRDRRRRGGDGRAGAQRSGQRVRGSRQRRARAWRHR